MGLRAKFNLVMLLAFAIGIGLAAALSYRVAQDDARAELLDQAGMMISQAHVTSFYTQHEVQPLLADQLTRRFLPQSSPFWVAKANFASLQKELPDYSFQQIATNPTNPSDRPTDWQADIIDIFRRDPATTSYISQRDTASGPILSISSPITVSSEGCLKCHSVPGAAPATMVDLYGPDNGFGWKMNEIVGAQIVSVPMQVALNRAHRTFLTVMAGLAVAFLAIIVLLNVLLHAIIIRPVRRISAAASAVSLGDLSAPEYTVRGRDEIASLADSFNRMRRSLTNALKMLEE